ncbi:hypothetical protein EK904_002759 [Melospiza melodia maxima]|nr:hypothetical protein EK904_002759 [Melospiza melodia maxima]
MEELWNGCGIKAGKRDIGLDLMALGGCPGAALLTPCIFNLLCHLLSHSVPLVSWQPPRPVQRGNPQYKRCGGGEGTLATLSSRFVKTPLHLPKPRHHTHEAAPFQDLWQRQPLQCFQRII